MKNYTHVIPNGTERERKGKEDIVVKATFRNLLCPFTMFILSYTIKESVLTRSCSNGGKTLDPTSLLHR